MLPNRFRITNRATRVLGNLKGQTGLTPNVLCRMALVLSVRDGPKGGQKALQLDGSEFNQSTLLGDYALAFDVLVRRLHGELTSKEAVAVVASHIETGIEGLRACSAINSLLD